MHLFNLLGPLMALLLFYGLGKAYVDLAAEDWNMLQRSLARWYVLIIYAYLALLVLNQKVMVKQAAAEVLLPPSKAESLAVFRILFFTYVALFFIGKGSFYHDWIQANELSTIPLWGEASTLFGYIAPHYKTVYYLGIASSLLVAIGFYTRYLLLLNALLCFLVVATPNFFGKFWHNQIYIWIAWLFVASRCYDVWSVDAWWAKRRGKPFDTTPKIAYSIPIRWIWLHLGIIYFFAGIFKLWNSGFDWALSSSMINQIQTEWVQNYDQVPLPRIDHYPILVKIGGLCLILFEILFIFLLLKPATRLLAVLGGLSFHNLSAHYMYIGFSDLQYSYITFLHKIRRPFAFAPAPAPSQQSIWKNLKWSTTSMAFRIGLVVFSLNFLCGFFSIHTYPFSSYPTYSALVPDEIDLIHFVGFDEMGTEIDILAEAQKARFCRENCTIFETQIIEAWKNGQPVDTLVKNYWHLWRSNIPVLSEVKHLKVYYHRTPVQPERRQEYIINTLIYENRISVDRE
jgi:hypothetical protein